MTAFVMTIDCGTVTGPPALFGFQVIGGMGSLVSNTSEVFTPTILRTDDGVGPDDPQLWIQLQRADGEAIAQDDFFSVEVPGVGTFESADADSFTYTPGDPSVAEWHWYNPPAMMPSSGELALTFETACEVNCACEEESDNLTLAEYRRKMLVRAGFAAIADNPPPGTAELFNTFLQDAQDVLYRKYPALETRRFFHWDLEEGQRFYGLRDDTKEGCLVNLAPYKQIDGAWLIDLNGQWLPVAEGIPPVWYTTVNQQGLPVRYEIRQCIEIFPAPPAAGYQLVIKGHFGKRAFTAEDSKPTMNGELVYLFALANALDYYGKPNARSVMSQAEDLLGQLVAGTHGSRRYVPGTQPLGPAVMPVLGPGFWNP